MTEGPGDNGSLAAAAGDGDQAAFAQLYDLHADEVHDFCYVVLRDAEQAADALHDTFVQVAALLSDMPDSTPLRPWLFALARDACLSRMPADGDSPPAEVTAAGGTAPAAWATLGDLPADRRAVVHLHSRGRMRSEEIGLVVGMDGRDAAALVTETRDAGEAAWTANRPDAGAGQSGGLTGALSAVPLLAAPVHLRAQVLVDASMAGGGAPRGWKGGYPPPMYHRAGRRFLGGLLAAVVLVALLLGGILLATTGGDDDGELAGDDSPTDQGDDGSPGDDDGEDDDGDGGDDANADGEDEEDGSGTSTTRPDATTTTTRRPTTTTTTTTPPPTGPPATLSVPSSVDLGATANRGNVTIANDGPDPVTWTVSESTPWMSVNPPSGSIPQGGSAVFTVFVDRGALPEGDFSAPVRLTTNAGSAPITIRGRQEDPPVFQVGRAEPGQVNASGCPGPNQTTVSADVTDNTGVASVRVFWGRDGIEARQSLSQVSSSRWSGTLGPFPEGPPVSFRFEATDHRGNVAGSQTGTITVKSC